MPMNGSPKGYELGLATAERMNLLSSKVEKVNEIIRFANDFSIKADRINPFLESIGTSPLKQGVKLIDLLVRRIDPEVMAREVTPA